MRNYESQELNKIQNMESSGTEKPVIVPVLKMLMFSNTSALTPITQPLLGQNLEVHREWKGAVLKK
jgi:hypothetical protein